MENYILPKRQAITVFFVFAFGYFLSCLLRAITATLSPILTSDFNLLAADLGLLAGGYFLGFARKVKEKQGTAKQKRTNIRRVPGSKLLIAYLLNILLFDFVAVLFYKSDVWVNPFRFLGDPYSCHLGRSRAPRQLLGRTRLSDTGDIRKK